MLVFRRDGHKKVRIGLKLLSVVLKVVYGCKHLWHLCLAPPMTWPLQYFTPIFLCLIFPLIEWCVYQVGTSIKHLVLRVFSDCLYCLPMHPFNSGQNCILQIINGICHFASSIWEIRIWWEWVTLLGLFYKAMFRSECSQARSGSTQAPSVLAAWPHLYHSHWVLYYQWFHWQQNSLRCHFLPDLVYISMEERCNLYLTLFWVVSSSYLLKMTLSFGYAVFMYLSWGKSQLCKQIHLSMLGHAASHIEIATNQNTVITYLELVRLLTEGSPYIANCFDLWYFPKTYHKMECISKNIFYRFLSQ